MFSKSRTKEPKKREKPSVGRSGVDRPKVGRPKDDAKRDAILSAARETFMERGPDGATIDVIADAAGVSRVTIYSHYENKEGLMAAVMEKETKDFASLSQALDSGDLSQDEVRDALVEFGSRLLGFIEQPHAIRTGRMMIGQANNVPGLTKAFFQNGPLRMHKRLARLIASAQAAGAIATDNPEEDADFLIGMWRGLHHIELQLNARGPRTKKSRDARVRRAVDLYLAARRG